MTLQKQAASTIVTYQVRADDPDYNAYQVFLEQGLGLAFDYGGLQAWQIGLLIAGFGILSPGDYVSKVTDLQKQATSDPSGYDAAVRTYYHEIYPIIRFFDAYYLKPNLQQVPESSGTNNSLEIL